MNDLDEILNDESHRNHLAVCNHCLSVVHALKEARGVIEFYAEAGSGTHNGLYIYALATKAREFLAKYPKGDA